MGIHSGKFGVVNGISTVRNWQVNDTMNAPKFIASNTLGGTGRRRGVKSWGGSFSHYGAEPLVMPGDLFNFDGYTAPANDVSGVGKTYSGSAIVDSIAITWNWGGGEIIQSQVNFSGHLGLSVADDTITDVTDPTVPEVCGTKIEYSNDSDTSSGQDAGFIEWVNLVQATLNISSANQQYVNSSTGCLTGRKAGPVDWSLSITEQNEERPAALEIGEFLDLKLYVGATEHWRLQWGLVREYSGLQVDRESGSIIQRTVNLEKSGFLGANIGKVVLPGAAGNWWPFTL